MSTVTASARVAPARWPLERVLFLMAGAVTLASIVLALAFSPWFLLLTAFVGLNQLLYVATGTCGAAFILTRLFGLEKGCAR